MGHPRGRLSDAHTCFPRIWVCMLIGTAVPAKAHADFLMESTQTLIKPLCSAGSTEHLL